MNKLAADTAEENMRTLLRCAGPTHLFIPADPSADCHRTNSLWRCMLCGGEVRGRQRRWYQLGVEHGRRSAEAAADGRREAAL